LEPRDLENQFLGNTEDIPLELDGPEIPQPDTAPPTFGYSSYSCETYDINFFQMEKVLDIMNEAIREELGSMLKVKREQIKEYIKEVNPDMEELYYYIYVETSITRSKI
jgi:hypothetical protein